MAFGAGGMGRRPGMGPGMHAMPGGARPSLRNAFVSLKNPTFRMLWFSMLASFGAMQMQMVARGWLAFELSGSFAVVGFVMIGWGLPMFLLSLVGGAVADRMDKRTLVLITQGGTGLLALTTATLITTGLISIPALFITGLLQGVMFAFNMPARQSLVAEVVPPRQVMNAIALANMGANATRIVGPAIAGVLLGVWGVASAYYVQSALYVLTLLLVLRLPRSVTHLMGAELRGGVLHEIGLGVRYVSSDRTLLMLMLMAFVPMLLGMPYQNLLPGFAVEELGLEPGAYGFMLTVTGVGALVGSFLVATLTEFPRKALLQMAVGIGFGAGVLMLGLASVAFGYIGALAALLVLGLFSNMYMTLNNTMIIGSTRPEFYGRVMSIYMLTFSIFPFMAYPMGVVADEISASTTFTLLGVAILGFMALAFVANPRFVFSRLRFDTEEMRAEEGEEEALAVADGSDGLSPALARVPWSPAGDGAVVRASEAASSPAASNGGTPKQGRLGSLVPSAVTDSEADGPSGNGRSPNGSGG